MKCSKNFTANGDDVLFFFVKGVEDFYECPSPIGEGDMGSVGLLLIKTTPDIPLLANCLGVTIPIGFFRHP